MADFLIIRMISVFSTLFFLAFSPAVAEEPPVPSPAPAVAEVQAGAEDAKAGAAQLGVPPEALQKLSPDQIFSLLQQHVKNQQGSAVVAAADPPAVAIVVPVAFFLAVIGVVALALAHGVRKDRQRHETLRLMIEKGATIPPELLTPPVRKRSDLRKGIILVSTGAGIAAMMALLERSEPVWGIGLVPALIGVGYLIAARLERPGREAGSAA
jgi:hypothetical protein